MALETSQIYYIIDDLSRDVTYGHGLFGGGTECCVFGTTETSFFSLEITFSGTSVLFIGTFLDPVSLVATMDSKAMSPLSLEPNPHYYGQWYHSPVLPDTDRSHTINITVDTRQSDGQIISNAISADYIAVSPGMQTPLLGRTLLADDTHDGFIFGGGWKATGTAVFEIFSDPTIRFLAYPFQNTTHTTSTPGSIFSFSYTGTNLTLYGVFHWDQPGVYDLVTTIDDHPPVTKTFNAATDARPATLLGLQQIHFPLFSTPSDLEAGNHNITFNLSKCVDQSLTIDYILYVPSFSSLAALAGPTYSFVSSATLSTSFPTSPPSTTQTPKVTSSSHIAAIAAGSVTGFILLSLIGLLLIWKYHNRQNGTTKLGPETLLLEPFSKKTFDIDTQLQTLPTISQELVVPIMEGFEADATTRIDSSKMGAALLPQVSDVHSEHEGRLESELDEADPQLEGGVSRRELAILQEIEALKEELNAIAAPPDYASTI
ncbi:hypothetical protein C8J56DRAFT_1100772 [Mycena floridula]|nr:hypothetical protein C8J56DRAFT_1100772 [Mycena floridula]